MNANKFMQEQLIVVRTSLIVFLQAVTQICRELKQLHDSCVIYQFL